MKMKTSVKRKALIQFFDTNKQANKSHSSSVNALCGEDLAIGLLKHYFEKGSKICEDLSAQADIGVPKEKKKGAGKWLDSWLLITDPEAAEQELYQVEIKSWSAHSLGGEELALEATTEQLNEFKLRYWSKRWDEGKGCFKEESVNKVLLNMKQPMVFDSEKAIKVKRLVCFWAALSKNPGAGEDFYFSQMSKNKESSEDMEVHVFSLSGYLRTLNDENLELDLPKIVHRLGVLGAIFPALMPTRELL